MISSIMGFNKVAGEQDSFVASMQHAGERASEMGSARVLEALGIKSEINVAAKQDPSGMTNG